MPLSRSNPPAEPYDRAMADEQTLTISGREVVVTHPDKLLNTRGAVRKLDLVDYYVAVAEGACAGRRPAVRAGPLP
jgi:hypothetical protein